MEIKIALKKLHEAYEKDPTHDCSTRADILYCIMKDNGLNPQIKCFLLTNDIKQYVIILDNMVYDTNIEANQNPIEINKYESREKNKCPNSKLIWENAKPLLDKKYVIDYLSKWFDSEFQRGVKPLVEKEYEDIPI